MSAPESISISKIIQALKSLKNDIRVAGDFEGQMAQVKKLLKNDETGIINTILDFMCHASTVPMKIETKNDTLDAALDYWQSTALNKDISIDVPSGLRELSTQYFSERWKSSFIGLNVKWGEVKIGNDTWIMPTRMWFVDGASITVEKEDNTLTGKKYFLDKKKEIPLVSTKDVSVIIRKPFASWYDTCPTPFLVRRGVLFNALLKQAIVDKQADVIQQIIPYLMLLKSGTDKLAELGQLATREEMVELKDNLVKATREHDYTGEIGKLIATLSYDVDVQHSIPDLTKLFSPLIAEASDKNICAGLGLIEIVGFGKNRQESFLNPKMLVEEVKDAVGDWKSLLEEVLAQMLERNRASKPKLTTNAVRVVPSSIKAFFTEEMKTMLRNLYDRGLIAKQTIIEDVAEMDFDVQAERRDKETKDNMDERFYPPVIQNMEQTATTNETPAPKKTEKKQDPENTNKKPGSPESKNFKNAESEEEQLAETITLEGPYKTIDELPALVKTNLPIPAQIIFRKAVNEALVRKLSDGDAFKQGWHMVKQTYRKSSEGKWIKKSK